MTDSQKLDVILAELSDVKSEQKNMRADITTLQADMMDMKSDMADMKSDMADMKSDMTALKLHVENETDRNISILAENHTTLISKLNDTIKAYSNNLILEVSVSGLRTRVERLETDMKVLKEKAAMA